jgi:hypothetical protein
MKTVQPAGHGRGGLYLERGRGSGSVGRGRVRGDSGRARLPVMVKSTQLPREPDTAAEHVGLGPGGTAAAEAIASAQRR